MPKSIDFSQPPYSLFLVSAIASRLYRVPDLLVTRLRTAPWNVPQQEWHRDLIADDRFGNPVISINDIHYDSTIGDYSSITFYRRPKEFNARSRKAPLLPDAKTVADQCGLGEGLEVFWTMPTPYDLLALRNRHDCAVIEKQQKFYSLRENGQDLAMTVNVNEVVLVHPHFVLKDPGDNKPFFNRNSGGIFHDGFGPCFLTRVTTDDANIYDRQCEKFAHSRRIQANAVWRQVRRQLAAPGRFSHHFDAKPTCQDIFEVKRRNGFLTNLNSYRYH
jgi:hypothetical protein